MKKLLIIIMLLLPLLPVSAQDSVDVCEKLYTEMREAYSNEDFSKAASKCIELAATADSLKKSDSDSIYISAEAYLARCYFRSSKPELAAKAADKALERMEKIGRTTEKYYAIMLDNAGLYYLGFDAATGLKRSLEALRVMNNYPDEAVSKDMQIILMHVAEGYHDIGKYQDAIVYEIRALNLTDKLCGKHSSEYIEELPYLSQYYRSAGEDKKAEDIDNEAEKLQDEYDNGERDVPDPDEHDLSSAEECHTYKYEAYRCADYYLNHKLSAQYMNRCMSYLTLWTVSSPDVNIEIGENESKLAGNEKSLPYYIGYLAGCVKYALDEEDSTFTEDMYNSAMVDLLNFYIGNRELTGKVKYLESFVDAYNKSKDKFAELLNKSYLKLENGKK